jgi:hypothetical protein
MISFVERVGDGKQILQMELCQTSSLASYLANYLFVLFLSSTSRSPLASTIFEVHTVHAVLRNITHAALSD